MNLTLLENHQQNHNVIPIGAAAGNKLYSTVEDYNKFMS
jgi:hypothetical protein